MPSFRCSLASTIRSLAAASAMAASFALGGESDVPEPVDLRVDATQLQRHLLRSEMVYPVEPGERWFWYPQWVPGVHGPSDQAANLAEVIFEDEDGNRLPWRRDALNLCRFGVAVPEGVHKARVRLTYIGNHPTSASRGVDSYGTSHIALVNFNTCILYPEDVGVDQISVRLQIRFPWQWEIGTAMVAIPGGEEGWTQFDVVSLESLVDSPIVSGRHFKRLEFETPSGPPARFCIVADDARSLEIPTKRVEQFAKLMPTAVRLFAGAPFGGYDFLILCSNQIPTFGLEHAACSLNCVKLDALASDDRFTYRPAYLLPHELVHAWCGKYRRPAGMVRADYHSAKSTELLWIYEGLTQYLMHLVTVRSGQATFEQHLEYLAHRLANQMLHSGRNWRPLADTAVSAYMLRGASASWNDLRRGQDYYDEGALFWLGVDCLLREQTDGEATLDDFCREFFAVRGDPSSVRPFDLTDVIEALTKLSDWDWDRYIRRCIYQPNPDLSVDGLVRAGYRLEWGPTKSNHQKRYEEYTDKVVANGSLGLSMTEGGQISRVIPNSVADEAGLQSAAQIIAVNRRPFSRRTLEAAVEQSTTNKKVELIVRDGDWFDVLELPYERGAQFPVLNRIADHDDVLRTILTTWPD